MPRRLVPLVSSPISSLVSSLSVACFATLLAAQNGPPTFVPKEGGLLDVRADDVAAIAKELPNTRLGKLLAEPDVANAWRIGSGRLQQLRQRRSTLVRAANELPLELPPWQRDQNVHYLFWDSWRELELGDLRAIHFAGVSQEGRRTPLAVTTIRCQPKAEGRWTRVFENAAHQLGTGYGVQAVADAKFEGFPAHVFAAPPPEGEQDVQIVGYESSSTWMLHLPGTFAFGSGLPEQCGTMAPAAAPQPGASMRIGVREYIALVSGVAFGGTVPTEIKTLGIDQLETLAWRARFVGDQLLDEIELGFVDAPTGLLTTLWTGTAPLPKQALPVDALLQLRVAVDLAKLIEGIGSVDPTVAMPEPLAQALTKGLTGGLAFGVAAPAKGGVVPRLYATFDVADADALQQAMQLLVRDGMPTKNVTYDGVVCTTLQLGDLPPALQPTWCVHDGRLHVAESPLSMRAFLQAQKGGAEAMVVDGATSPEGTGDALPTFDLRIDLATTYRIFHGVWLPLYEVAMAVGNGNEVSLVHRVEMPEPDVVAPHLGAVRGVLRQDGNRVTLQQLGPLGGLATAAVAMTYGPMLSASMHRDYWSEELERQIAKHRATAAWTALEAFHQQHQRWPNDLAELFVAAKLPADALLVPGDELAEAVPLPAGEARVVRSSFRYFPQPVTIDVQGNDTKVLLVELRTRPWNRIALAVDGSTAELYGDFSQRPIDQFGK